LEVVGGGGGWWVEGLFLTLGYNRENNECFYYKSSILNFYSRKIFFFCQKSNQV
jgi:hypothetical protein